MAKFYVYMTLEIPVDDAEDEEDACDQAQELVEDNGADDYVTEVRATTQAKRDSRGSEGDEEEDPG